MVNTAVEAFFFTLGAMVANKKLLASWLILLSAIVGMTGDRVFRTEPRDALTISMKLDNIQKSLDNINSSTQEVKNKLEEIKLEQAKVRTELDIRNEKNGQK